MLVVSTNMVEDKAERRSCRQSDRTVSPRKGKLSRSHIPADQFRSAERSTGLDTATNCRTATRYSYACCRAGTSVDTAANRWSTTSDERTADCRTGTSMDTATMRWSTTGDARTASRAGTSMDTAAMRWSTTGHAYAD